MSRVFLEMLASYTLILWRLLCPMRLCFFIYSWYWSWLVLYLLIIVSAFKLFIIITLHWATIILITTTIVIIWLVGNKYFNIVLGIRSLICSLLARIVKWLGSTQGLTFTTLWICIYIRNINIVWCLALCPVNISNNILSWEQSCIIRGSGTLMSPQCLWNWSMLFSICLFWLSLTFITTWEYLLSNWILDHIWFLFFFWIHFNNLIYLAILLVD